MSATNESFLKNIAYAFLSQGVSLLLSILTSLILPKFLGLSEYGYFQLFLFYSAYVGFAMLGLNDGIYLRTGGKKASELNKDILGGELLLALFIQLIMIIILVFTIFFTIQNEAERTFVLLAVLVYSIFQNFSGYLGYIFQAINETKIYSKSILIEKVFFSIFLIAILLFRMKKVYLYIIIYIVSKIIACLYCGFKGKNLISFSNINIKKVIQEYKINVSVGVNLMIANIASMLILGIARQFIDMKWGIQSFGKFSFLLSIINFFLLFISQASMVLFPQLRISSSESRTKIYLSIRKSILILSPFILLAYIPIVNLIAIWLPNYADSLHYLIYLLPLCIFETKTSLLSNTYLKVFRLEKKLLIINIMSFALSFIFSIIGCFLFDSMEFIIIGVVISLAFRSVISELILAKKIKYKTYFYIGYDLIVILLFITASLLFEGWLSTIVFLMEYSAVLIITNLLRRGSNEKKISSSCR